jgi:hypothetical protein
LSHGKDGNKSNHNSGGSKEVPNPPQKIVIPNPLTIRHEATTEENNHYTEQKDNRIEQLRTAQRLNRITIGGVAATLLSLLFVYLSFQQSKKALEVEQRGWLQYKKQPDVPGGDTRNLTLGRDQPVNFPFWMKNAGKSPAKNVDVKIFVDIVEKTKEPELSHVSSSSGQAFEHIVIGIVFPDEDFKQTITRRDINRAVVAATQKEVDGIQNGTMYFVVYGEATYNDIFGTPHWTRFCDWQSKDGTFTTKECTQFNDVDKE